MLVQTFVVQATIERLHEAVLLPPAGRNVMSLDAGVLTQGEHGMTDQLGAIGAYNHARQSATLRNCGEFADDTPADGEASKIYAKHSRLSRLSRL